MNFPQRALVSHDYRRARSPAPVPNVFGRFRTTLAEAVRAYSETLVCRALTIEPAARARLTVDVHFCEVR